MGNVFCGATVEKKEYYAHTDPAMTGKLPEEGARWQYIAHITKDGRRQNGSDHSKNTAKYTSEFATKIGLKQEGEVIGLVHDIGKASKNFQKYIHSAAGLIDPDSDDYIDAIKAKGKIDHSSAGSQYLYNKISSNKSEDNLVAQILSLCVASHHSGLIDCISPDGKDVFSARMAKPEELTCTNEVITNLNGEEKKYIDSLISNETILKSLTLKINELKENNDSKETFRFKIGLLVRFLFSCLIDADRIDSADIEYPENKEIRNYNQYISWNILIERLNDKLKTFENKHEIDILRSQISQQCFEFSNKSRGIYQLTVPTGGGKTLASLRFALNHALKNTMERIFYIIPYTSIIDQNATEVRKILEEKYMNGKYSEKVVLEHHSNLTPEKETRKQNILSENWDAPIVFTTSVQFLEALFGSGTRNARRMHQLANSVIIFDEVQTIPVKCVHMFNVALRFLVNNCCSTALLCTATQPLLDKVEPIQRSLTILPEQRIIPNERELFKKLKRVEIQDVRKIGGWSEDEIIELAKKEIKISSSVLIVVNTKSAARTIYQKLKEAGDINIIYHLSTSMCPTHRINALDVVKNRLFHRQPVICVSTQLIEAGVDIDFGTVIRYLAGLDSIAQAAGRCNRNGKQKIGKVWVVNPTNENLDKLEDIRIGIEKVKRVLDEYKHNPDAFELDILNPSAMEQYYKYYFYERKDKMNYPVSSKSIVGRNDNLFSLLSTNTLSVQEYQRINNGNLPMIPIKHSFHTASETFQAIDSLTRGLIVPYEEGKTIIRELSFTDDIKKQYTLIRSAQRFSVNLFSHEWDKLDKEKNAISEVREGAGIYCLDEQYYSQDCGVSIQKVNDMPFLSA